MLILDNIEKAERNVLPLLNNLLENREMVTALLFHLQALEDGRFLVSPSRWEDLLQRYSAAECEALGLVRTHPNFRVIAIGLPAPRPYSGNPLDPPLRSRLQARYIGMYSSSY